MVMLLGKKVGMTQIYDETGNLLPVTVIQAGPCVVMQVKTIESDGYNAIQYGFEDIKPSCRKKPEVGHSKRAKTNPKKYVREMRLPDDIKLQYEIGEPITVSIFAEEKFVDVTGTSKGKGFAGVMKRHGFGGFPASHGTERKHRAPGSISSFASNAGHGAGPKKGKRMSGHLGHCRVTTKNHQLVEIDEEKNLLIVKGSVPGPAGGYCIIRSSKKGIAKK
ncbi:MAG: 50S ribosomal protein L3 [Sedimentisphaerales bacterium]|nr:50S ribosomal protein L3 [Sedimentisphaerales bacterium]